MDIAYFHALHHHLSVNTTKASVASRLYISNVSFFYILYVYKYVLFYIWLSAVTQSISNTGCFTFLREPLL